MSWGDYEPRRTTKVPRSTPTIRIEVTLAEYDEQDGDLRHWIRATEILLRARARRDARVAATTVLRRTILTVTFTVAEIASTSSLAIAA